MISMLIPASAIASKISAATPGWLFMPGADDGDLRDLAVAREACGADRLRELAERGLCAHEIVLRNGERDVRASFGGAVLNDHVDVDSDVGQRAEDTSGDARHVGHAEDGDLGFARVVCDARDDRLFEHVLLLHHPRALVPLERRAHVELDAVVASVLDRAELQHAGAVGRELEHLFVGDRCELARVRAMRGSAV